MHCFIIHNDSCSTLQKYGNELLCVCNHENFIIWPIKVAEKHGQRFSFPHTCVHMHMLKAHFFSPIKSWKEKHFKGDTSATSAFLFSNIVATIRIQTYRLLWQYHHAHQRNMDLKQHQCKLPKERNISKKNCHNSIHRES